MNKYREEHKKDGATESRRYCQSQRIACFIFRFYFIKLKPTLKYNFVDSVYLFNTYYNVSELVNNKLATIFRINLLLLQEQPLLLPYRLLFLMYVYIYEFH